MSMEMLCISLHFNKNLVAVLSAKTFPSRRTNMYVYSLCTS